MSWLPDPLHPAIVHFPIALSIVALLFELLARHPRGRALGQAAGFLLVLAALGAVAAVLTGNAAHDEAIVPAAVAPLLARHEDVGELAMWLLLGAATLRIVLAWRGWLRGVVAWAFVIVLAAATGAVAYNGYLGGKMVFDHGLGTAPVQRQVATPPETGAS
jgi:uncharacterized membrane protein